ncbi:CPBP family intramembrane glutamic endopeptidase [Micromonospora sp. DT81.3]|uniref:CPBP family intramembrane glutamic endopeptidase n=1 Tax=Micromonospora sp. DT81.3 TaxID=3416523 RepID=UPI003CE8B866
MPEQSPSAWKRFWERGGAWRALLLAAVYYGLYQLMGLLVGAVFGDGGGIRGEEGSAMDVLIATALPIILASVLLVVFALSLGWLKELFGRQPVPGRRWMWVAVGVVLAINVSGFLSIDYARAGAGLVAAWLFTGLFVGFAEEVLTRGFVVTLMRKAGHGEIAVALVSSGIFAALHIGNLFTSDQGLATTSLQVIYTFWFGLCMYLTLRVTGHLIWPILLHATTDPTLLLHGQDPASNLFGIVPALSTYLIILTGVILLIVLIVSERRRAKQDAVTGAPIAV